MVELCDPQHQPPRRTKAPKPAQRLAAVAVQDSETVSLTSRQEPPSCMALSKVSENQDSRLLVGDTVPNTRR